MGISDDIKPRKVYSYSNKAKVESNHNTVFELKKNQEKKPKEKPEKELVTAPSPSDTYQYKDFLEDDFFSTKEKVVPQKKTKKHKITKIVRVTLWIFTIIAILIVFYKNIDRIETLLLGPEKTATNDTNTDESYTSEPSSDADTSTENTPDSTKTVTTNTSTGVDSAVTSKSNIKIEILNGNGISGSADKVRDSLVNNGFTIARVANAKKFTYASTYIYYKTGAEASMEMVKAALSDRSCIAQKSDPITTGYDIVIVVGKK